MNRCRTVLIRRRAPSHALWRCALFAGGTVEAKLTRQLFQKGKAGERMVAVATRTLGTTGKRYRVTTDTDLALFREAEAYLAGKQEKLTLEWGINPIPDEELPLMSGVFNVPIYGMHTWGDLFNARQKLALITFVEKDEGSVSKASGGRGRWGVCEGSGGLFRTWSESDWRFRDPHYAFGIISEVEAFNATFTRQALPMVWNYSESSPFNPEGAGWPTACKKNEKWIEHASSSSTFTAVVTQTSATNLTYPDNFFDAIFTDPPYYNSVPYADLSDFFYVWLKRTVGDLYPELFSTPLTPKKDEITEMAGWDPRRYAYKDKNFFEENLKKSFQEIYRVLKPNGIAVIVYAHKSTEGWETLINSLLDSGLIMTGAWPLDTENKSRRRSQDSAALASSIYIVARKIEREPTGFYNEVKAGMTTHLNTKLHRLWGGRSGWGGLLHRRHRGLR